jgi:hypothetical protein
MEASEAAFAFAAHCQSRSPEVPGVMLPAAIDVEIEPALQLLTSRAEEAATL